MNRKSQITVLVSILALAAVILIIALPNILQAPQQVEVVSTETGETSLVSNYAARYANILHSRTEDGGFVLGNPDAPVTVVEFADFMCPHCQDYQEQAHQFIEQFVATGKAKFEYRLFPVVNPEFSDFTARLAECVDVQQPGMFWAAHDLLFDLASRGQISLIETPQTVAEVLALNLQSLNTCVGTAKQHETDTAIADGMGVNGTPTVLLRLQDGTLGWIYFNGQLLNQGGTPLAVLQQIVEAENPADFVVVPQPVLYNLIETDACAVPCWNGIIPGETAWEDAKTSLETRRDFTNFSEQVPEDNVNARILLWQSADGLDCCRMVTEDGSRVDEIFLLAASNLAIGQVMGNIGEPQNALARATQGGQVVNLFYPDKSTILYIFVAQDATLDEVSQVVGVSFLSPARMSTVMTEITPPVWTGYAGLADYAVAQPTPAL